MKWKDEIVEDVRKTRDAYAARFDYDISRICDDLRTRQRVREEREAQGISPNVPQNASIDVLKAA